MLSERSQIEKATCFPIPVHALAKAKLWETPDQWLPGAGVKGGFDYESMQKLGQFCSISTVAVVT